MSATLELNAELDQALANGSHDLSELWDQGRALAQADNARQWDIGDWLLTVEARLGRPAYPEALAIFRGYRKSTLKDFATVARNVQPLVRTNDLSWAHHKLVARFSNPEYQSGLLREALKHDLPLSKFRTYINKLHPPKKAARQKSFLITLDEEDLIWLRVVAYRADKCSLADAARLIVHDYHARCKAALEHTPYVAAHESLVVFFGNPEAK
jgi:hypothetical protein